MPVGKRLRIPYPANREGHFRQNSRFAHAYFRICQKWSSCYERNFRASLLNISFRLGYSRICGRSLAYLKHQPAGSLILEIFDPLVRRERVFCAPEVRNAQMRVSGVINYFLVDRLERLFNVVEVLRPLVSGLIERLRIGLVDIHLPPEGVLCQLISSFLQHCAHLRQNPQNSLLSSEGRTSPSSTTDCTGP